MHRPVELTATLSPSHNRALVSPLGAEPLSCIGLWVALEDASVENGCMRALPASHGTLRCRFVSDHAAGRMHFEPPDAPKVGPPRLTRRLPFAVYTNVYTAV